MGLQGRILDLLSIAPRRRYGTPVAPSEPDQSFVIPSEIDPHLLRNSLVPLLDELRHYGRGRPGIERVTEIYWVIRDRRGRIVAAAKGIPDDPPVLDVEVDTAYRRRGYATMLYEAMEAAGVDVEAGSDASLREGLITPLGYAFQIGRRRKRGREGTL
jgi:GNAT superfamily N-acetyltransferase